MLRPFRNCWTGGDNRSLMSLCMLLGVQPVSLYYGDAWRPTKICRRGPKSKWIP